MNSKLNIRYESAKLAVMLNDANSTNIVSIAKYIEKYILGDANLPEVCDSNESLKLGLQALNLSNNHGKDDKNTED